MGKESEKRRYTAAGNLGFVLLGLRRYSHYWLFWCAINTLFGTILPFIAVFLPKLLIDELTGLQRIPLFVYLLLGSAGATIVCSILVQAGSNYQWPHSSLLRCRLMLLRGNKAMGIDYKLTEDADFLSTFEKARKATGERVNTERDSLMEYCNAIYFMPSYLLAFAGYCAIVFTLHPLILVFLIAGLLVSYRIGIWYDKLEYQSMARRGECLKGIRYFSERFTDLKIAKDVRLFGLDRLIMAKYLYYSQRNFAVSRELMYRRLSQYLIEFLTDFLRDSVVIGYIIYSALNKGMPVGDIFMYFLSVNNLAGSLKQIIDSVVNMRKIDPYISDLRAFLDTAEDQTADGSKPSTETGQYTLQFQDVWFRYPGSETWLLQNFSLTIRAHEKIALVGLNGAGKTTLVKLMTRLYDPDQGAILLNGTDIRTFSKTAYYALFSVLFQDYALFGFTVAENISMRARIQTDMQRVWKAIEKVGLKDVIDELPHGVDTCLLRQLEDDGVELSGGQAQRIALARAIYKEGDLVILDEPTAALDPLAEFDLYSKFSDLMRDKTTVFVSHRLSSTRFCDRILLIDEGRIAEEGTHAELMARNGLYARIFEKQAYYYGKMAEQQEGGEVIA